MNELFLNLAKEAKLKFSSETALSPSEQKFAELIIKECITTVESAQSGYRDYRSQIEVGMRDYCVEVLKNHFGVEE